MLIFTIRFQNCGDVLTKKKLDPHRNQCYGASYTCLDCMVHFQGTDYRAHTSCISEAQKYQGALYKGDKRSKAQQQQANTNKSRAVVPRNAYVEDAPDAESTTIAIIDVPPKAPSPPPAVVSFEEPAAPVNVFDFLVNEDTPNASRVSLASPQDEPRALDSPAHIEVSHSHGNDIARLRHLEEHGQGYAQHGYSYGAAPVQPTFERYDSYSHLPADGVVELPAYTTPAPKRERTARKEAKATTTTTSDKKRKRQIHDLDQIMTDVAPPSAGAGPGLHTGLTGGLNRLLARPEDFPPTPDYSGDGVSAQSPPSPAKRSKRDVRAKGERDRESGRRKEPNTTTTDPQRRRRGDDGDRDDSERRRRHHRHRRSASPSSPYDSDHARPSRKHLRAIEYAHERPPSAQPTRDNALMPRGGRAALFMSFVNKGPDSERGCSVNKALKRYHREVGKDDDDEKALWRCLRLRRNSRGEIVLFA
ncbi:hypothetical protein B0A49_00181 [Cryomyces minteri]|uniref:Zinc finger C2H2 LYAR-type domain-containing protein n=1 Tax=Cryomyces minteri TaxID=331657 RepID=A0A4U0XWA6_9PEZI|nr:hypothetical protein B0A49_00181 [Cryomyces minteri]